MSGASGGMQVLTGSGIPTGHAARSLEAWIKTNSADRRAIAGYGCCWNLNRFELWIQNGNQIYLYTQSSDLAWTASYSIGNGGWHHIVVTYDGNLGVTAYLDGQSLGTQSLTGQLNTGVDNNGFLIGQDPWCACANTFNGTIDEVALYPAVLTAAQVSNHFNVSGHTLSAQPANVVATPGQNQVSVTWSGGTPFGYYVVSALAGTAVQNSIAVAPGDRSATLYGLSGGTAYTIQVAAVNTYTSQTNTATSAAVTPSGGASGYTSAVYADAPSAYYRLSETDGSYAADSSGNGRAAAQSGSGLVLASPGGLVLDSDPGLLMSGSGLLQYAQSAGLPIGAAARSLEVWFKTSATSGGLLGYGNQTSNGAFTVSLSAANKVFVHTWGTDPTFTTPYNVNDSRWHHLVVTYDGAAIAAYLDGSQFGSQAAALNTQVNGGGLEIGNDVVQCCNYFSGSIDEAAVYPIALSAARIAAHWQAGGYVPGQPTAAAATAGVNSATVSWTAPSYAGLGGIANYIVTALSNGATSSTKTVDASTDSVNFDGLSSVQPLTFTVSAKNTYGSGAASTQTAAVTPRAPAMPGSGTTNTLFGNYFAWRTTGYTPFPAGTLAVESRNSLPALSTWTVEGWVRGFGSLATSGSGGGIGIMGGSTPDSPGSVNAGISIDAGGGFYAQWPGGSSSLGTICSNCGWVHIAVSFDGTNVRGFVNGSKVVDVVASGAATAGPAGIYDHTAARNIQMDELRISSTARYTANFTVPTAAFTSDASTSMLWHFDDYSVTRIGTLNRPGFPGDSAAWIHATAPPSSWAW